MKPLISIIASPVLCLAVLGGIAVEKRTHPTRQEAAPFHARAKMALDAWPETIGDDWTSRETEVPLAAIQLLHPNAIISRRYVNIKDDRKKADLLIVQCTDPTDMSGHYPPNCYPNAGQPEVYRSPRVWQVAGLTIHGMEYHFETTHLGEPSRKCVYDFFILPGRGITGDMEAVRRASADYRRQFYGAAQFQVVFEAELPQSVRDEIFTTLIGAQPAALTALDPGKF